MLKEILLAANLAVASQASMNPPAEDYRGLPTVECISDDATAVGSFGDTACGDGCCGSGDCGCRGLD